MVSTAIIIIIIIIIINCGTRKRKMPGEMAADAGHKAVEETTRVMKSALDADCSSNWFGYSV